MTTQDKELNPSDPRVIIAGIRQFGLAPDGSDLRDLEAAIDRLFDRVTSPPLLSGDGVREALKALDDYWTTDYPEGPDSHVTKPGLYGPPIHESTAAIWRQVRAALSLPRA